MMADGIPRVGMPKGDLRSEGRGQKMDVVTGAEVIWLILGDHLCVLCSDWFIGRGSATVMAPVPA